MTLRYHQVAPLVLGTIAAVVATGRIVHAQDDEVEEPVAARPRQLTRQAIVMFQVARREFQQLEADPANQEKLEARVARRLDDLQMFQASRLPEPRVLAIFDEDQWETLHRHLASWAEAETLLIREGFVFDTGPITDRTSGAQSEVDTGKPARGVTSPE